jgi:hypothetical protein
MVLRAKINQQYPRIVILSKAKDLKESREILRFAQDDEAVHHE